MKFQHKFIICILFSQLGCTNKERSDIEIIKLDPKIIQEIQLHYDSSYIEIPESSHFGTTIEHYFRGPSKDNLIFKDSLGNIVAVIRKENGVVLFSQEYYPNGQLKGKTNFLPGKIEGPVTYYYENGRIKSIGQWEDFKQVGKWKNFDDKGYLISIEYYDKNGRLEKEEKIK